MAFLNKFSIYISSTMKKNLLLLLISLLSIASIQAQLQYDKLKQVKVAPKATLNLKSIPDPFSPALLKEAPLPSRPQIQTEQHNPGLAQLPHPKPLTTSDVPVVVKSFAGQGYQFSAPNDNHLAVGNNGKMVSVLNTNMTVYDTSGTALFSKSLSAFADTLGVLGYTFDPRVIYDPVADRFVLTFLNGYLDSTSQIIIAFSQTSDPDGLWHFYLLNGNPLNNSTWSDYPAIGLNQNEFFISFNTFTNGSTNNSGYTESTIWQIDKAKGYAGDTLVSDYYYNITWNGDTLFNTTPVTGGLSLFGPQMYFLNSNPFSSTGTDTIYILEITNSVASGLATLQISTVQMGLPYYEPQEAKQKNNHTLITNDARVQSALLENNVLHFVLNTQETSANRSAVYYGRIQDFTGARTPGALILTDTLDLAYGAIAPLGDPNQPGAVVVGCLHSSVTAQAGHSAFYIDNSLALSSRTGLKSGANILNVLSGTSERWGDYTGIAAQPGEPGSIWYAGSYSSSNARNNTWISKVRIGQPVTAISPSESEIGYLTVFPVPAKDRVSLSFELKESTVIEIALADLQGKHSKTLIRDWTRAGKFEFSIATENLSSGVYMLQILGPSGEILGNKKFTILH